jgi:hypothetical protein
MADQPAETAWSARLRRLLDQPFVGFAPWVLLSVVEGPNRVVLAAALACGLAVITCAAGAIIGLRPKILDVTAIIFFGGLTIVAALGSPSLSRWLGVWAGELSNVAIAVIAAVSLAVRKPFTLQYARESTDAQYWDSPLFLRINDVITAVWASIFVLVAVVGYIGDGPLHQPDNVWTNWIIQIALVVFAIKFTNWYPDFATAEAERPAGSSHRRPRHPAELLQPLAAYLVPVGVVVMVVAGSAWWVGAAIMVVGIVASRKLRQLTTTTNTVGPTTGTSSQERHGLPS